MRKESQNTDKNTSHSPQKNKLAFYLIGLAIPILFFVLLELLLNVVGFGKSVPLFIENPSHPDYFLARPNVMQRYFPFSKNPPAVTMETDFFLANKPANGIRIFVQGGSTAAGFPYGLGASISGTIEQRLRQSMPKHQVEVINTAMSAVNSHTLLDLSDDIIAQQPDMILIYAGHNEFLGILGASSNFTTASSFWLTRVMLNLKELRLFQLFQWLYAEFETTPEQNNDTNTRTTMMAQVAANQSIELDSNVYKAGLYQFETNIADLLAKYEKANIPVLIASIGSNHKDQPPLKSNPIEQEFKTLVSALGNNRGNLSVSELQAISLSLLKSKSALLHFELGKLFEQSAQLSLATKHYELAVANDLLKFRAPQQINEIIKRLADKHQAQYIDALAYFQSRSANNIVGSELMLEHLHPNLRGYYVISEAFYQGIASGAYFSPWTNIPINQAWPQRLILPSEEYNGFATVAKLKSQYPFVEVPIPLVLPTPTDQTQELGLAHFNKEIDWLTMVEQSLALYRTQNNDRMTLKTLQILSDALPHNGLYAVQAAEGLQKVGEKALAVHYYRRALFAGSTDSTIEQKIKYLGK